MGQSFGHLPRTVWRPCRWALFHSKFRIWWFWLQNSWFCDLMILIEHLCTKGADKTLVDSSNPPKHQWTGGSHAPHLAKCQNVSLFFSVALCHLQAKIKLIKHPPSESHRLKDDDISCLHCAGDETETTDEELRQILVNHSRHARGQLLQREECRMWPARACSTRSASTIVTVSFWYFVNNI